VTRVVVAAGAVGCVVAAAAPRLDAFGVVAAPTARR
jgi:hypothetical protein